MNVAHRHAINNYESGMEPSLRKKNLNFFFTLTTVNAELVFNAVIEKEAQECLSKLKKRNSVKNQNRFHP